MFVKAPHSPIKHPPNQICILIAFWLHFPPLRLLFIGALFLLRRHRHPWGAHLQQRTRTELRGKLLQLECNRICTPAHLDCWTQRSQLPGEVRPLMYRTQKKKSTNLDVLHNRSPESTRQNEPYKTLPPWKFGWMLFGSYNAFHVIHPSLILLSIFFFLVNSVYLSQPSQQLFQQMFGKMRKF